MTYGFALGNGRSRQGINVQKLRKYGLVAGCNRIYEEEAVDILVATDRQMAQEIEDTGYGMTHEFWTRRPRPDTGSRKLERPTYGYSSGPASIAQLCERGCTRIYLLGFDLGSPNQYVNNIYAGTAHYKTLDMKPTYYGNWIKQLQQVCERWSNNTFYRVIGPESTPYDFERTNFVDIDINNFTTEINSL